MKYLFKQEQEDETIGNILIHKSTSPHSPHRAWSLLQEQSEAREAMLPQATYKTNGTRIGMHSRRWHHTRGIEVFITKGLAKLVESKKEKHVLGVLKEQRMQQQRGGEIDVDALCSVSKRSSRWARNRARTLAEGYSKL